MLEVTQAAYAGNYAVHLVFSNGRAGIADLEQLVCNDRRPIFAQLRERTSFSRFNVAHSALVWNDDLDIAPEYTCTTLPSRMTRPCRSSSGNGAI